MEYRIVMRKIMFAVLIILAIISFAILVNEDETNFLSPQSMVIYYYSHGGEEIDIIYLFDSESKERIAEAISERKLQFFRTNKNEDNILNCFFKMSKHTPFPRFWQAPSNACHV